jgi:hypothetical protein
VSTLIREHTELAGFGLAIDFLGDVLYATDAEGALLTFNPANGGQVGFGAMCQSGLDCFGQCRVYSMSFRQGTGTLHGLMNTSCCQLPGLRLVTIGPITAGDPPTSTITVVGSVIDGLAALAWSPEDSLNTLAGVDVVVQAAPAALTFETVTEAGNTTLTASPTARRYRRASSTALRPRISISRRPRCSPASSMRPRSIRSTP